MNILVLNYEYPPIGGGGAAVSSELCQELVKRGNNVEVVTMRYADLPQNEVKDGVRIHRIKCWRKSDRVCHPWEQLTYCLNAYTYILRNISITDVDVIHCHFIIPTGLLGMWLKKKTGKKLVLTAHGSDVLGHNNSRFGFAYKLVRPLWVKILKNADVITAPSSYLFQKIKDNYSECNCKLVPNGIHVRNYSIGPKKRSIITLCRLQKSKGIQQLIEACSVIPMNGWEVNILGDGPYRKELEKMVLDNGLGSKIHFRGHLIGEEKKKYLSEAAVFFSGSQFEAFPISVLEATLSGCNVIASNIEPHVMLVGEAHVYCSFEELVEKLSYAISCDTKWYTYGNEKFDWENVCKQYVDLFAESTNALS